MRPRTDYEILLDGLVKRGLSIDDLPEKDAPTLHKLMTEHKETLAKWEQDRRTIKGLPLNFAGSIPPAFQKCIADISSVVIKGGLTNFVFRFSGMFGYAFCVHFFKSYCDSVTGSVSRGFYLNPAGTLWHEVAGAFFQDVPRYVSDSFLTSVGERLLQRDLHTMIAMPQSMAVFSVYGRPLDEECEFFFVDDSSVRYHDFKLEF